MARKGETIARIAVRGFKSIWDEQEIEVRPLTLLAGANSSGKSSLIQPLLLLKQTLEAPGDPGALLLDGPCVRFTKAGQLLSQGAGTESSTEFAVRVALSSGESLEVVFSPEKGVGFDVASMGYCDGKEPVRILPAMAHEDIVKLLPEPWKDFHTHLGKQEKEQPRWSVYRERCFLSFELLSASADQGPLRLLPFSLWPGSRFIPYLRTMLHVPGLRGNPERTYRKGAGGPDYFPGTFEQYVASIISLWQGSRDARLGELRSALRDMGLTWQVKAEPVDDTKVELRVGRLTHGRRGGAQDLVSIADVGFGVSQSLPVLVALIAASPGQVVYLEQPEIHLHPRAQRKLAHVMGDAAKRGVVVIAETHSSLVLQEVQTLVATGALRRDIVKLHWFQRQDDGRTTVTAADLDENGAYGAWPADFDKVELDAAKAYLDASQRTARQ